MKQVLNNFKNTYFKGLNHYFIEQIILLELEYYWTERP